MIADDWIGAEFWRRGLAKHGLLPIEGKGFSRTFPPAVFGMTRQTRQWIDYSLMAAYPLMMASSSPALWASAPSGGGSSDEALVADFGTTGDALSASCGQHPCSPNNPVPAADGAVSGRLHQCPRRQPLAAPLRSWPWAPGIRRRRP